MTLPEIIATIIIVLIIGMALLYVIKAKKKGQKCIGCPHSKTCSSHSHKVNDTCKCCGSDIDDK